jgi:long-chain fatty acid transport protein
MGNTLGASQMRNAAFATRDMELDARQTGTGFAPILGVHFNYENLNFAAKYEFKANIELTNETEKDDIGMYPHNVESRSDVPALLSLAGSYDISPRFSVSLTYIHHFEKQNGLKFGQAADEHGTRIDRTALVNGGTNELMLGFEWRLTPKFTISTGGQYTKYNLKDDWHNDITHHLDNFTLGLGAAYRATEKITINLGGINTFYQKKTVYFSNPLSSAPLIKQSYQRTNKALAIGIDYKF